MTKPTKITLFKASTPRAETPLDRTTRAAMEIVDDESEQRQLKTERLRKARLEREESGMGENKSAPAEGNRKKP